MKLRYRFRFYPTPEQEQILAKVFGCCRYIYNWGLTLRKESYRAGKKITYDPEKGAVTDNPDANALLSRKYREGWTLNG